MYQHTQTGPGAAATNPQRQGQTGSGYAAMQQNFDGMNLNGRSSAKGLDDGFGIRHMRYLRSPTAKDGPESQYDGFILRPSGTSTKQSTRKPWKSVGVELMKLSQEAFWDEVQIRRQRLKKTSTSLADRLQSLPADLRSNINDIIEEKSQNTQATWNVASIKREFAAGSLFGPRDISSAVVIIECVLDPENGPRPEMGVKTGVGMADVKGSAFPPGQHANAGTAPQLAQGYGVGAGNPMAAGGGFPTGRPPGIPGAMGGMQGPPGMGAPNPGLQGPPIMSGMHPGGQAQQGTGGMPPGMQGQQGPRPAWPTHGGGGGMPPQGFHSMPPPPPPPPAPTMSLNRPPLVAQPAPLVPPMMQQYRPPQLQQQQQQQQQQAPINSQQSRPMQAPPIQVGAGSRAPAPAARGPPQGAAPTIVQVSDSEISSDDDQIPDSDEESWKTGFSSLGSGGRSPQLSRPPTGHGRAVRVSRSPSSSATPRQRDSHRRSDQKPLRRRPSLPAHGHHRHLRSSDSDLSDGGHRRERVPRDSIENNRSSGTNRRRRDDDHHHRHHRRSSSEDDLQHDVRKLTDRLRTLDDAIARQANRTRLQDLKATRHQLAGAAAYLDRSRYDRAGRRVSVPDRWF